MDKVILKGIKFDLAVGSDAWRRSAKPQPVIIDLEIQPVSSFEAAAAKDDLNLTLDYGKPYKKLVADLTRTGSYPNIHWLIAHISDIIADYAVLGIEISLPKALLPARLGLLYHAQVDKSVKGATTSSLSLTIRQIAVDCIIGVNPHERAFKQSLSIDISVPILGSSLDTSHNDESDDHGLQDLTQEVAERVQGSSYQTIEALATAIAQIVTMNYGYTLAKIRIEKPYAYTVIEATSVELTRTRTFFENKDFWKVKLP